MARVFLFALIGGLFGALLWALVAAFLSVEIGWIAVVVGLLAGVGARAALGDHASLAAPLAAALVASLCVFLGKAGAVAIVLTSADDNVTDEFLVSVLADEFAAQAEADGRRLRWPEPANARYPEVQADYPPPIWTEAQSYWDQMTIAERQAFRREVVDAPIMTTGLLVGATIASFSLFDFLWFALAVSAAYRLASHTPDPNHAPLIHGPAHVEHAAAPPAILSPRAPDRPIHDDGLPSMSGSRDAA